MTKKLSTQKEWSNLDVIWYMCRPVMDMQIFIRKELACVVIRHTGCLVDALNNITSTCWCLIGDTLWICMGPNRLRLELCCNCGMDWWWVPSYHAQRGISVVHYYGLQSGLRMAVPGGEDQCCGETPRCYSWHHDVGRHMLWLQVTYGSDSGDPDCTALRQWHLAFASLTHPETSPCYRLLTRQACPLTARVYRLPMSCWGSPVTNQVPRSLASRTCGISSDANLDPVSIFRISRASYNSCGPTCHKKHLYDSILHHIITCIQVWGA